MTLIRKKASYFGGNYIEDIGNIRRQRISEVKQNLYGEYIEARAKNIPFIFVFDEEEYLYYHSAVLEIKDDKDIDLEITYVHDYDTDPYSGRKVKKWVVINDRVEVKVSRFFKNRSLVEVDRGEWEYERKRWAV